MLSSGGRPSGRRAVARQSGEICPNWADSEWLKQLVAGWSSNPSSGYARQEWQDAAKLMSGWTPVYAGAVGSV